MEEPTIEPMPRMLVLNYVKGSLAPAGARQFATTVLCALGVLCLLGGLLIVAGTAWLAYTGWFTMQVSILSPDPSESPDIFSASSPDAFTSFVQAPSTWIGLAILGLGLAFLYCGFGVRRGSRRAALAVAWLFVVPLIVAVPTVVFLVQFAIVNTFDLVGMHDRLMVLWLIPGFLFLLLSLFAWDLHKMLRWLARDWEMENRLFWQGEW